MTVCLQINESEVIASGSVALGPEDKTVRVSITRGAETATVDFEFKDEREKLYKLFVDAIKRFAGQTGEPSVRTLPDIIPTVKSEILDQTHIRFSLLNWAAGKKNFGVRLGSMSDRQLFVRIDYQGESYGEQGTFTRVITYTFTLLGA
jgi:hypothetical protein